jgi:ABC-2 type transport system ATP-binding protein
MQRRIGIAQAMINDPSFLILDEPTSGLDPLGCREVKDLILTLKKRGKTVLVTSHLLSDVEDICDRVIILYGGKIRAQGALNDLLTVSDSTTITTPVLGKEEMEKVLKVLREELHGEDFKVDHPRRSLEEFFLDVIARAKSESVETAGVVSGGRIAKYLESGDEKSAVLESLLQEETPQAPAPAPRQEEIAAEKKEQPARVDLSDLMEEKSVKVSEEAPDRTAAAAEKLSEADKKLNDILGNRK